MISNIQISSGDEAKVALVTGGAVRVGKAISMALGRTGYSVAIHFNRSEESAVQLGRELKDLGVEHVLVQSDFTRPGQPAETISRAARAFGRIDLLVNNAAILLDDTSSTIDLARMKLLNVDAPLSCLKSAMPHLAAGRGCAVNIGDAAGVVELKEHKFYSRTKAALIEMTREKAAEAIGSGVRINAVCPGTVLPPVEYDEDRVARIAAKIPMGRIGRPEDVAEAVLYLASASYVTGQTLFVDGGLALTSEKKKWK
jgi:pteridine reductase